MTENKYMLISLEDERAKKLAKVLSSKTAQKIINHLAEKDSSEQDLAEKLKVPINTIEYNIKNLIDAEMIEKSKNFFWSQKGKKIVIYQLSNKSIIISPKSRISSKIKSILPAFVVTIVGTLIVYALTIKEKTVEIAEKSFESVPNLMSSANDVQTQAYYPSFLDSLSIPIWGWFFGGAIIAIILLVALNWRKL